MKLRWGVCVTLFVLVFFLVGCENRTDVVVRTGAVGNVIVDTVVDDVVEVVEDSPDEIEAVENVSEDVVENATAGETHIVRIEALRLKPDTLTISVGDTVIWKNNDQFKVGGVFHRLISYKKEFRSERFFRGEQFEHTFEKAGTFVYTDLIFTDRESMRGEIIVEE
jgi:plastocyanin